MRILMAHNRYLFRGGEDGSTEAEIRLLREHGHHVEFFERNNALIERLGRIRTSIRTVWSAEVVRCVRDLLRANSYDVVHVQNSFPLISPSIYYAAKAEGVAVVQSIRNYRLLCLNAEFLRADTVCEACLGRQVPWPGVIHRCYRGSYLGSTAVGLMLVAHRSAKTWQRKVDRFIALTEFARNKLVMGGFNAKQIVVKPNFVDPDPGVGVRTGKYALFVGRLSSEKGVMTMLEAWSKPRIEIPLRIVGDGPLEQSVKDIAEQRNNVTFEGRQSIEQVYALMQGACFLVFPSIWYEGMPRTILEAFATGTPVVGSRIGGVEELVEDGVTGLLFSPGDSHDLEQKVLWAAAHPDQLRELGKSSRRVFEQKYTGAANIYQLLAIYEQAMAESSRRKNAWR